MALNVGDQAPDFSGKTLDGENLSLADYRGQKNVFVVFYPAAFSGVCSAQLPRYNQNYDGFKERNTEIVAISADNGFSQQAFCDSLGGLDYPMLSDKLLKIADAYGVKRDAGIAMRSEFAVDKDGIIRWLNIEASAGDDTPTMDDIFSALDAL